MQFRNWYIPNLVAPDFTIHGIEITQGIQCYDVTKGLAGCPDNSLPLVNKKDTTARIYLKVASPYAAYNMCLCGFYHREQCQLPG